MNKPQLRELFKEEFSKLGQVEKEEISRKLSFNLHKLIKEIKSKRLLSNNLSILGYSPLNDEFDWSVHSWFRNQTVYLPSIESGYQMSFYKYSLKSSEDIKKVGLFYKCEQVGELHFGVNTEALFIVPGRFFSTSFERLGRGKGYYDRFFKKSAVRSSKHIRVGVGADFQVLKSLPKEEHDVIMDYIVTDKKIYRRS